jgi:hypothetical protein
VLIPAFSDLHRDERSARSLVELAPQVDVVAGASDFASMHHGLNGMIDVLSAIDRPVLLIPGNNETDDAPRTACVGSPAAGVLHGEATDIDGVTYFGLGGGVPVTPWNRSSISPSVITRPGVGGIGCEGRLESLATRQAHAGSAGRYSENPLTPPGAVEEGAARRSSPARATLGREPGSARGGRSCTKAAVR